jgi:hypothetical protein
MSFKRNMKNIILILFALVSINLNAQDKIEAERPNESITTKTLSKNTFQAELGFRRIKVDDEDKVWRTPNALLRYGLLDKLELRLETTNENQTLVSKNVSRKGIRPVELGVKVNVIETRNEGFSTSVVGQVGLPTVASSNHQLDKAYHRIRLLLENKITDKLRLNYNFGSDWDSEEQEQNWVYSFTPELEVADNFETFVEVFGYAKKGNTPENIFDAGFAYFPSKKTKLDLSAGVGLNSESPHYFVAAGFSFSVGGKK